VTARLTIGRVVMSKDKLELYEFLIRASLVFVFLVTFTVGVLGTVAISRILMRQTIEAPKLFNTGSVPESHNRRA
jgi:hypothetical protein